MLKYRIPQIVTLTPKSHPVKINRGSRNLVGIIVSYSHPKFRPLPHGNKSIGGRIKNLTSLSNSLQRNSTPNR